MNVDNRSVESFVLRGYKRKKGRSVEKDMLYSGNGWCVAVALVYVVFHFMAVFRDEPMRILPLNLVLAILVPIVVFLALEFSKRSLANYLNGEGKEFGTNSPLIFTVSMIGTALGGVTARVASPIIPPFVTDVIMNIIVVVLVLMFVFFACVYYYRVYLIRKFCPNLQEKRTKSKKDKTP